MATDFNKLNGHEFDVADTTPNAMKRLSDADEMLRKYNKENDDHYLFDAEFRGKYLKAVADVVLEYAEEDFNPDKEFYEDGDLEVSKIQDARSAFLGRGGMISI